MLGTHQLADFIAFPLTTEGRHGLRLHFHPQRPESKKKKEEIHAESMVNLVKNCPFFLTAVQNLANYSTLLC